MKPMTTLLQALTILLSIIISTNFLTAQHDPTLWGMNTSGGTEMAGTLFKFDPESNQLDVQLEFDAYRQGNEPGGRMAFIDDVAYGTTTLGGENDQGVLYAYDLDAEEIITLHFFDSETGNTPGVELLAVNGKLYGGTVAGGTDDAGVLYEFDPTTGTYTVLHEFDDTNDGKSLLAGLCVSDDELYGITYEGGSSALGTLFKYNLITDTFTLLHTLVNTEGTNSSYAPIEQEGTIYGVGRFSGENSDDQGRIFKYDIAGESFTSVPIDFSPSGSLVPIDGKFYGTVTNLFAWYDAIYEFDPSNNSYEELRSIGEGDPFSSPRNSFIEVDGWVYGLAGLTSNGFIYRYHIETDQLELLHSFDTSDGNFLESTLVADPNGMLYGSASTGGLYDGGTIFSYSADDLLFYKLHDFERVNGRLPNGPLVEVDGIFYGTTNEGGEENRGVLFAYNPENEGYTSLFHFETIGGKEVFGQVSHADGILYGTTGEGGDGDSGVIYQYDLSTNTPSVRYDFGDGEGSAPAKSLLIENNKLYGGTYSGGSDGSGLIFEFDLTDNTMQVLHELINDESDPESGLDGTHIETGLLKIDNLLYGTAIGGGLHEGGTLFQFDLTTETFSMLHHFTTATGTHPGQVLAVDGVLYGTTNDNGSHSGGALFAYDLSTDSYEVLHHFGDGEDGSSPAPYLSYSDGLLYGMTEGGGESNGGTLFQYTIETETYSLLQDLDASTGTSPAEGLLVQIQNEAPEVLIDDPMAICAGSEVPAYEFEIVEEDGDAVDFTVTSSNTSLIPNASLSVSEVTEGVYELLVDLESIAVGETVITITAADGYGGEGSAELSISGLSLPAIGIDASSESICVDESVTLTATGGTNYHWEDDVSDGVAFVPEATATYTVTGENENECSASASIEIVVNPLPTIGIDASSEVICADEPVTLSGTGGTTYTWDGGVSDGVAFEPEATTTYTVTGEDDEGCTANASIEIVVHNLPVINEETTDDPSAIDVSITEGLAPYLFDWDHDGVGDTDDAEDLFNQPAGTYALIVTDANGCLATATFDLEGILSVDGNTSWSGDFQVYPNPVTKGFNLSIDHLSEVLIYDLQGNLVKQYPSPLRYYNVEDLDNGVYILALKIDNRYVTRRMIKM